MREEAKRGVFELFELVDQNPLQVNMTNVWGTNDTYLINNMCVVLKITSYDLKYNYICYFVAL